MARFDLTDFEWSVIQPLLPNKPRGVRRVDDRRVVNGILWRLRTGAPWAPLLRRRRKVNMSTQAQINMAPQSTFRSPTPGLALARTSCRAVAGLWGVTAA